MKRYQRSGILSPTLRKSSLRERSLMFFAFNGSAYVEDEKTWGLHHYLEHLAFRGWSYVESTATRKYVKFNAVTDDARVYFYVSGLNDGVQAVLDRLDFHRLGFMRMPNRKEFETERDVILQEYDSMLTHRPSVLITSIQRRFFNYYGPFGKRRVLENVTYKEMVEHARWFEQPSSILVIAGEGLQYDVKSLPMGQNSVREPQAVEPRAVDSIEIENPCGTGNETILCDFAYCGDIPDIHTVLLKHLWSEGADSPIMRVIRDKHGLAYSASMYYDRPCSSLLSYITTGKNTVAKVRKLLQEMYRNYEHYITRKRFAEVREMMLTHRKLLYSNTCTLSYATHATSPFKISTAHLEDLTYENAMDACNLFVKRRHVPCSFGETIRLGGT